MRKFESMYFISSIADEILKFILRIAASHLHGLIFELTKFYPRKVIPIEFLSLSQTDFPVPKEFLSLYFEQTMLSVLRGPQ